MSLARGISPVNSSVGCKNLGTASKCAQWSGSENVWEGEFMVHIKKVVVPTDFSNYSRHALKYAVALAELFGARVYVVHGHDPYPECALFEGMYLDSEVLERLQTAAKQNLDAIVEDLRRQKIDAEPVFGKGRPFLEIVHQADRLEADVIVIATHGRKGVSHLVFGSTAERVVRMASCPVLTVKHPEHDFV